MTRDYTAQQRAASKYREGHREDGNSRVQRGIRLACERAEEIVRLPGGNYSVPSASRPGRYHTVNVWGASLGNPEREPSCSCEDHVYGGNRCMHLTAASVVEAQTVQALARAMETPVDYYYVSPADGLSEFRIEPARNVYGQRTYAVVEYRPAGFVMQTECNTHRFASRVINQNLCEEAAGELLTDMTGAA